MNTTAFCNRIAFLGLGSCPVLILLAILTLGSPTFAQNAGVGLGSGKKAPKASELKALREREARSRAKYNPAANKKAQQGETVALPMEYHGVSESLLELSRQKLPTVSKENGMRQESNKRPLFEEPDSIEKMPLRIPEALVQTEAESLFAPIAGATFEGPGTGLPGFSMTGAPPDSTMAVGPNHIVGWVNSQYAVFNKAGGVVLGPVNGNTLFTGVGGVCETTNRGDPILQYDRLADRWILSQFAFTASNAAPWFQCIAVSTTGNPAGTYVRYTVDFSAVGFNDYGKLGIWNDAYYIAYNVFNAAGANTGAALCASDRTKMLAGDPSATTLCAPNAFYAGGAAFLPADLDGPTLPSDTTRGGVFMRLRTGFPRGLRIMRLKPDFTAGTVTLTNGFGGATGTFIDLPVTTTLPCNDTGGTCVAQPGTVNTLDTLGTRLMYRLAYRNRGGVESLVVTHSADPDGAGTRSSAMRWYEVRNPLGNPGSAITAPFIYQGSLYDPGATGDRWMGSVAMDKSGNILAGYSMANAPGLIKPSIAVAGRSQCDTLNTLQAENIAHTGTGSQTGTLTRWGDYSTMQVDPADDTTFWYITQYLAADGTFNWRTRIVSYRFPTTNAVTDGDFSNAANWSNGLPSATVGGTIPAGRTLTVSAPATVSNMNVESGASLVMNADLTVTGSLTLGTQINTGTSTLGLACQATVSGASPSIFVVGNIRKDYCATGGFTYPTGTANGYSPVNANITSLVINPSSLTVKANQGNRTGMAPTNSLQRFWTLTESGDL
ncbi:MAG: hypothetical protein H7070_12570, partial [Saprospiraceae bacterium]|nr:hypothetical protein [Pyrinomonadaceae bacterium]